MTSRRTKNFP